MCKSRDPFFYTGVIVRARWRASLRDARCARYNGCVPWFEEKINTDHSRMLKQKDYNWAFLDTYTMWIYTCILLNKSQCCSDRLICFAQIWRGFLFVSASECINFNDWCDESGNRGYIMGCSDSDGLVSLKWIGPMLHMHLSFNGFCWKIFPSTDIFSTTND